MRQTVCIVFFALSLLLSACQKNHEVSPSRSEVDVSETYSLSTIGQASRSFQSQNDSAAFYLESRLQWISYLTAKIVLENLDARAEVMSLFLGTSNTIDLVTLLDARTHPFFYRSFVEHLNAYLTPGRPNHEINIPPGLEGFDGEIFMHYATEVFLEFVLEENCIELYFPTGLDFNARPLTLTSTAHPLSMALSNFGIIRNHSITFVDGASVNTNRVLVNANYIRIHPNVIVARPYTISGHSFCSYLEYGGIDFRHFLQN